MFVCLSQIQVHDFLYVTGLEYHLNLDELKINFAEPTYMNFLLTHSRSELHVWESLNGCSNMINQCKGFHTRFLSLNEPPLQSCAFDQNEMVDESARRTHGFCVLRVGLTYGWDGSCIS